MLDKPFNVDSNSVVGMFTSKDPVKLDAEILQIENWQKEDPLWTIELEKKIEYKENRIEPEEHLEEHLEDIRVDEKVDAKENIDDEKKKEVEELNWLEQARQKLKKIDRIESKNTPDRKKLKNRISNMTPGSSGKKVKRMKENRILTIKKLWENTDRNKNRKRIEKEIEIETDVKKIISGIEASIESGNNSICSLKGLTKCCCSRYDSW